MKNRRDADVEARFAAYVDRLVGVIGHADRAVPLRNYCSGLLLPLERKSVEPLAALARPDRVSAEHQSLLHFVGQSAWSDAALMACVREQVLPAIECRGPVEAWIIDDTAFPKKGDHSVGVARQYCGELGKTENCQALVSLSVASEAASLPVAFQLFLPEIWANDPARRRKAHVPEAIMFQTKGEIALDQIRAAQAQGLPPGVVLADAGYGHSAEFRKSISDLGLTYAMGVSPVMNVWRPGEAPQPRPHKRRPGPWRKGEAPPPHPHQPAQVQALALELPDSAWQTVSWREGSNRALSGRFAFLRVCCANGDGRSADPAPEEWLLIEWPADEARPSRFWLSTLSAGITPAELVRLTKLRWRIERDYLDLKQECGLGHYEGRGWRGFHHHIALSIAAYGFLICETQTLPPSATGKPASRQEPAIPRGAAPRGSPATAATPHAGIHRHHEDKTHPRHRQKTPAMSMLSQNRRAKAILVTQ